MDQEHPRKVRTDGMQVEFESGRDPEVPASTANAPEQIGVFLCAGSDLAAISRHELDRTQVVDGQAELPLQPANATAQGQARDARVADDPHRAGKPVGLCRVVQLAEQRPAVHPRRAPLRIHGGAGQTRDVDDDAIVTGGEPRQAVSATSDCDRQVHLLGSCHWFWTVTGP